MTLITDIENFSPDEFTDPGVFKINLNISAAEVSTTLPVTIINGSKPGKTLVVTAGVHGDELEGIRAIQEVIRRTEIEKISGRLILVPVANMPAFDSMQRLSPIDGSNLARTFPGDVNGTITERLAYYLATLIIAEADLFLDLHSSGIAYQMPLMTGYDAGDSPAAAISKKAAYIFGTPVVWGHEEIGPGRTISSAAEKNIPWLYVESPNGGRVSADDLPFYINGIFNLMRFLNILEGTATAKTPKYEFTGNGDVDASALASESGFFVPHCKLLQYVENDDLIGEIRDLYGKTKKVIRSSGTGNIVLLRAKPLIEKDEPVYMIV